ncbi:MAG: DUF3108 domain-containing protein [Hyphomicrobium sp.]
MSHYPPQMELRDKQGQINKMAVSPAHAVSPGGAARRGLVAAGTLTGVALAGCGLAGTIAIAGAPAGPAAAAGSQAATKPGLKSAPVPRSKSEPQPQSGPQAGSQPESNWPQNVSSVYKLSFNGFDVGTFAFKSTSNGKAYSATSNADVSALFGAFKWKGTTTATGQLAKSAPQPSSYLMNFKTKSKIGMIRLGFDKGAVKTVSVEPKKDWISPEIVPVKAEHMKSVFDPMSAVLAMTHAGEGNPCAKTLAIFDGKVRFNLVLSYKGRQKFTDKKPTGQPSELYLCKVRYEPVAGHKPKDFVNPWVDYSGIEIALRPVPSAGVYVPYSISVPTSLGAAVMQAERVDITTEGKSVIALTR